MSVVRLRCAMSTCTFCMSIGGIGKTTIDLDGLASCQCTHVGLGSGVRWWTWRAPESGCYSTTRQRWGPTSCVTFISIASGLARSEGHPAIIVTGLGQSLDSREGPGLCKERLGNFTKAGQKFTSGHRDGP